MNNVGFITNLDKDPDLTFTKKLVEFVKKNGCKPMLARINADGFDGAEIFSNINDLYTNVDFVVVLGGDGTILRVARSSALHSIPILGVNLGTLGYLADVEKNDAENAVKLVLDGKYSIEKRMMIEAFIDNNSIDNDIGIALNDVAINNGVFSRMIKIGMEINGQFVDNFRADGIIISTPTGSTAYNLSAGGPILKPDTELMAITYVCPHALFSRPYVVSGNDVVRVNIGGDYNNVILSLDGQQNIPLKPGDIITVRRSKYYTNIIKTNDLSFYDILRRKMIEVRK